MSNVLSPKARPGNSNALKDGAHVRDPLVVLNCVKCPVLELCPRAMERADGKCAYEIEENQPDLDSADSIISVLRRKVKGELIRFERATRAQTFNGRVGLDKEVTTLSNTLTKDLQVLLELSVRFGIIDEGSNPPTSLPTIVVGDGATVNLLQVTRGEFDECQQLRQQLLDLQTQEVKPLIFGRTKP